MNLSPKTVTAMQNRGYDVVRVSSVLPENTPDLALLEYAAEDGRVIITQDLEFGALLAIHGYDRPSVITLRLSGSDPDTIAARLIEVIPQIENSLSEGAVITVEDRLVRIRPIPIS